MSEPFDLLGFWAAFELRIDVIDAASLILRNKQFWKLYLLYNFLNVL